MKFRVDRDALADAVAWTARTLPTRPTVPVLAGLRLDADPAGSVTFSAFDYEVSAQVELAAEVSDGGTALVSGRLLADICRSLPGRPVELVSDGGKVGLTCGSARFTLLTLPAEEFPELPAMPGPAGTVPAAVLAGAVGQVAVAAGRDDMLPVLTGIRVEIEGEQVTLAATDRYRLAVRDLQWRPERPDAAAVALVPARTLADTAKSLSGEVTLALAGSGQDSLLGFEAGGRRSTSRLLDGEFPKYRTLFPAEAATVARIDTTTLVESVKRVSLVAERNTPVRLSFSEAEVVLEAGSGEDAQASESLAAAVEGEPVTIGFNPGYLLDGLGAIASPVAHLSFTQATRPAVIRAADPGEGTGDAALAAALPRADYRYLLMPVRLTG